MTIRLFLNKFADVILNPLITLLFVLAVAYFTYSIIRFLSLEPGDNARNEARKSIIWGIVGIVIMISVYGLIQFVFSVFGIDPNDPSLGPSKPYLGLP